MLARMCTLLIALGFSAILVAQTGHPAKGSWSGDLLGSAGTSRIRLLIDDHNGELYCTVNPGPNGVEMSNCIFDADTWTLTIRSATPEGELVLTGVLSNIGSWVNRKYRGTYTLGNTRGEFDITLS